MANVSLSVRENTFHTRSFLIFMAHNLSVESKVTPTPLSFFVMHTVESRTPNVQFKEKVFRSHFFPNLCRD